MEKSYRMKPSRILVLFIITQLYLVTNLMADVRLPAVLTDGMVLQRDKVITIWGWQMLKKRLKSVLETIAPQVPQMRVVNGR